MCDDRVAGHGNLKLFKEKIHPKGGDVTTGEHSDFCQVLGVADTANAEEIKASFQRLVNDFHAAGKPKNIDDVEWLRRVVHAYHALSDNSGDGHSSGYDYAAIEGMNRAVDKVIARQKIAALRAVVGDPMAEIIWAHLKLRNI